MRKSTYARTLARIIVLALAATTAGAGTPAVAQSAEPSAEWQFREDAENCRAYRMFGTGDDRVLLQLRSFGPGSPIEMLVASAVLPHEPRSAREVQLSWDGEDRDRTQVGILGMAGTQPNVSMQFATRPVSAFFEGRVINTMLFMSGLDLDAGTMQLRIAGTPPITLGMGSLREPIVQLEQCEAALLEKWGFGSDYTHRIGRAPEILRPADLDNMIFYPSAQLLNRVGTFLQLRLKVDENGKVKDCVVQAPAGPSLFGSESCKAIRKGLLFQPAEDRQGRVVESFAQIAIAFARFD